MTSTHRPRWAAAGGVLLLAALVYWPGLNGPLILDDAVNLEILRVLASAGEPGFGEVIAERGGFLGGRPVSWATFVLNWRLAGDDVWVYKLVNLALHLANGLLAFAVARMLLGAGALREALPARWREWCSVGICALWLLTPMQVSTVLYVIQRMTLLAAFFALLGIALYCSGRGALEQARGGRWRIAAALLVCWPLAALSKQNGTLLPVLLLAIELLLFRGRPGPHWPRRVLAAAALLLLAAGLGRLALDPEWVTGTYALRDFTMAERLLTQPRVLWDYALNVLQLPGGSALGLFHDDFPVSRGPLRPPATALAAAGWCALLAAAWWRRGRASGAVLFGPAFFVLAHALEAGPFPLEIYFEHRNYLPSFGLWLAAVSAAALLARRLARPRLLGAVVAAAVLGHGALTMTRVLVWTSWQGIVTANVRAHPDSARARAGAAALAFTGGDLDAGLAHLQVVREVAGPGSEAAVTLTALVGSCLAATRPDPQLLDRLARLRFLPSDPYTLGALHWLRSVVIARPCPGLDLRRLAGVLHRLASSRDGARSYGRDWELFDDVGRVLAHAGLERAARMQLREALERAPRWRRREVAARLRALEAS